MHALISCIGSAGDVHPFIAIGQALRGRGHRVDLLTSPYFRERVESAGLGFIPISTLEDYQEAVRDIDLWHPRRGFPLIWRNIERNLRSAYQHRTGSPRDGAARNAEAAEIGACEAEEQRVRKNQRPGLAAGYPL